MVKRPPKLPPLLGNSVRNANAKAVTVVPQEEADAAAAAAAAAAAQAEVSQASDTQPPRAGYSGGTGTPSGSTSLNTSTASTPDKTRRAGSSRIEYDDPRKELGRGEFGTVYLGYVSVVGPNGKSVRKPVAVKEVQLRDDQSNRELDITNELRERRHDHIIKVYETLLKHNKLHVVMEYMDEGTLKGVLERVRKQDAASNPIPLQGPARQMVSDAVVAAIAVQVLSAVNFLHSNRRTLHRYVLLFALVRPYSFQHTLWAYHITKLSSFHWNLSFPPTPIHYQVSVGVIFMRKMCVSSLCCCFGVFVAQAAFNNAFLQGKLHRADSLYLYLPSPALRQRIPPTHHTTPTETSSQKTCSSTTKALPSSQTSGLQRNAVPLGDRHPPSVVWKQPHTLYPQTR